MENVGGERCWHEWTVMNSFVHTKVEEFTVLLSEFQKRLKLEIRG